jgi:hypothetical protein
LWREKVLGVIYLPTIQVVPLCQFFWFWREIVFGCTVSKKDSHLVSLRERGSIYLSLYCFTVTIVSQKYQELSLQVEISEY